jgi:hypothetical protein
MKKQEDPLPRNRFVIALILVLGVFMPFEYKTPPEPNEATNTIQFIGGTSIKATRVPPIQIPETLGMMVGYSLYGEILKYDWNADEAFNISACEAKGNPEAVNWERHRGCRGSFGDFQIACVHFGKYGFTWENKFDRETNVRVAYELWKREGWRPWQVCGKRLGLL